VQGSPVMDFLAGVLNYTDPATFGAGITGASIYYVLFADRGRWANIALFLISIPVALHVSPIFAVKTGLHGSGVALFTGALGLMFIEKLAFYTRHPSAFIKTLRDARAALRHDTGGGDDARP